jgi:hypothetical protein
MIQHGSPAGLDTKKLGIRPTSYQIGTGQDPQVLLDHIKERIWARNQESIPRSQPRVQREMWRLKAPRRRGIPPTPQLPKQRMPRRGDDCILNSQPRVQRKT